MEVQELVVCVFAKKESSVTIVETFFLHFCKPFSLCCHRTFPPFLGIMSLQPICFTAFFGHILRVFMLCHWIMKPWAVKHLWAHEDAYELEMCYIYIEIENRCMSNFKRPPLFPRSCIEKKKAIQGSFLRKW